jgi:hypothetical protein
MTGATPFQLDRLENISFREADSGRPPRHGAIDKCVRPAKRNIREKR